MDLSHAIYYQSDVHDLDLHSLPTRRSSDLRSWTQSRTLTSDQLLECVQCNLCDLELLALKLATLDSETKFIHRDSVPDLTSELRSEEHTSELQSRENLVCRLLLEKKNSNES